jgi:hypothetical protein
MKPEPATTRYAARVVGPLLVAAAGVLTFGQARILALADAFVGDDLTAMLAGFLSLIFGLVILAFHWKWASPAQSVVTLLGVIGLIRGAILLLSPQVARGMAQQLAHLASVLTIAGVGAALIGIWLSYIGWVGKAPG